ncbi:EscU/YscU/HrcU family type III secretion system export apparatus switch protein [Alphaproteobacteria bacterium]|jgi:flagellar biosynthetic protein FlhB|nr:EscU/YscU/HrcU family type III secretion system export apparatus switch protein [Alphaproteobacteria bacterium]MDA9959048.1 EscU/YscU/HrcU family type III secretion system export apparatus switch protein [Alphaproteobacteria bacterium]MDB3896084.1 EscU/YscU/HrcU family type III secretion system export apparatus switch protein [Alphaproteobacteria bacterium]MDC3193059.1 EscU/YscU/HrcU family type III secretion system export apparatus switch protein [Alphaproteobacteria bacterium]MDC6455081.1 
MAEEGDNSQEKTEDPSQRKLEKAAEDGKVLTSKDMFVFTGLFVGLLMMFAVPTVIEPTLGRWAEFFSLEPGADLDVLITQRITLLIKTIIITGAFVGVPMMVVSVLTQAAVAGSLNFAPKAMAFKGNRINPLKGLQRMVSVKALVELGKASLKVVLLFSVAIAVLYDQAPKILQLPFRSLGEAVASAASMFPKILGALLVVLAVIALLDYMWQRHTHIKELKMSKQDQKDEYKQTDGSPEVKAKIRRMQMENSANAARQQTALNDVPSATAIITNPTHFAVALKYDVGSLEAPKILAMGRGKIAEMIIERGNDADVTIFQSPLLARALFFSGEIGREIPEMLYQAVAVVLAYIYRVDRGEDLERPDVELPEDMRFDEFGKPLMAGVGGFNA